VFRIVPHGEEETKQMAEGTGLMIPRLMTPSEVADAFGVDPKTVTRWARDKKIAHIFTPGGHRRYPADEVSRLLQVHGGPDGE
jgi:excisionase family DNA binding protein